MKSLLAAIAVLLSIATTASAQTVDDGWNAYDAGDYEKAKSIFLPLAKSGNAKAMNAVGLMYSEGKAYPKDNKVACDWFKQSSELRYASAEYNYANCFYFGSGREQNTKLAFNLYENAAAKGHDKSQIALLLRLHEIDNERAAYWGQKAVDQNSALARYLMWSVDFSHTGQKASPADIVCSLVMISILGKDWRYCD